MPRTINLAGAFGRSDEHSSPRIAGEVNDFQVTPTTGSAGGDRTVAPLPLEQSP